jgi:hypothetical protein
MFTSKINTDVSHSFFPASSSSAPITGASIAFEIIEAPMCIPTR